MRRNRLARLVALARLLPGGARRALLSRVFGRAVPFVGTAGISYDFVSAERVELRIRNRRRVRNHIQGVHAAAMALLAETATGFVLGMNVPDDRLPLIKSMHIDYRKRAKGDLRAVASLTADQRAQILRDEKGEVAIAVAVTDEDGETPIECAMIWAWIPKMRQTDKPAREET